MRGLERMAHMLDEQIELLVHHLTQLRGVMDQSVVLLFEPHHLTIDSLRFLGGDEDPLSAHVDLPPPLLDAVEDALAIVVEAEHRSIAHNLVGSPHSAVGERDLGSVVDVTVSGNAEETTGVVGHSRVDLTVRSEEHTS